jgi:hypothetical protein
MIMLIKINKVKARKLYSEGKEIILCGDRVSSFHILGGWSLGCPIKFSDENPYMDKSASDSFDDRVNGFEFYLESELGRRSAYYIQK